MQPSQPTSPSDDTLWKHYALQVDLYKFYLDIALKFNIFYYAATGAIVSYYFSKPEVPWMKYALLLPILISCLFGALFVGAQQSEVTRLDLFAVRDRLNLNVAPEYHILKYMLIASAVMFFVVAAALICLIVFAHPPAAIAQLK